MTTIDAGSQALGLYSRKIRDFSKGDTYLVGKSLSVSVTAENTRHDNMKLIISQYPEFANDLDKLYYFKIYMFQKVKKHGLISEPDTSEDYPEISGHGTRIDFAKIFRELNMSDDTPEPEKTGPTDSTQNPIISTVSSPNATSTPPSVPKTENDPQTLLNALVNNQIQLQNQYRPMSHKNKAYNAKLKFVEDQGIEQFLSAVDSYCDANDIINDENRVKVALAALDSSDHGLTLKECLVGDEKTKWKLFKNKLVSVLGKDFEYYDELFNTFKRGTLSPGLALAKLSLFYKKSFPVYREQLTEDDTRKILRRFIRCLDQPVQGLIKAEEYRLNMGNIANRVQQLERAYGINNNPLINAITDGQAEKAFSDPMMDHMLKIEAERSKNHQQLIKQMDHLVASLQMGSKAVGQKSKPVDKKKYSGLKNYCLHHITGTCNYGRCKFIHADGMDVPDTVRRCAEQILKSRTSK